MLSKTIDNNATMGDEIYILQRYLTCLMAVLYCNNSLHHHNICVSYVIFNRFAAGTTVSALAAAGAMMLL